MRRGRRLALDVGDARIGVASCDPDGILATPVETVPGRDVPAAHRRLKQLVEEYEPIEVEKRVCSVTQQYAGTLDHYCRLKGEKAIIDVKTGKLDPVVGLQLTGYLDALKEETGEFVRKIVGVQLNVDGTYTPKTYVADFPTWRGAVRCAWWKRENLHRRRLQLDHPHPGYRLQWNRAER